MIIHPTLLISFNNAEFWYQQRIVSQLNDLKVVAAYFDVLSTKNLVVEDTTSSLSMWKDVCELTS